MHDPRDVDPDDLDTDEDDDLIRDPGTDPETAGIPEAADDEATTADVPEPQQIPVPTDEPGASLAYGTTAEEQNTNEPLAERLEEEQPDQAESERLHTNEESPPGDGALSADTGYYIEDDTNKPRPTR